MKPSANAISTTRTQGRSAVSADGCLPCAVTGALMPWPARVCVAMTADH